MDKHAADAFRNVFPILKKALARIDEHGKLPKETFFGSGQSANQAKLDALSDQALAILGVADVTVARDEYRRIEGELASLRKRIDGWRLDQVTAPERSMIGHTREQYRKKIEDGEVLAKAHAQRRDATIDALVKALKDVGLTVTRAHARLFLIAATGGDQLAIHAAFHNAKQLLEKLAELGRHKESRADDARQYYGFYMVLLRILIHAHDQFLTVARTKYLLNVKAIQAENRAAREETMALLSGSPQRDERRMLDSNLRAQELTERAAVAYETYLDEQVHALERRRAQLQAHCDVVANTYRTVSIAAELVLLMDESRAELRALHDMKLPDLQMFETPEAEQRFVEISRKVTAG